jgi:hypothetical protein
MSDCKKCNGQGCSVEIRKIEDRDCRFIVMCDCEDGKICSKIIRESLMSMGKENE